MSKTNFFVSLHDLRPSVLRECDLALNLFRQYGLDFAGLAVIPHADLGHRSAEEFGHWCASQSKVLWLLHGYEHSADVNLQRSWLGRQLQKICHNQAEFAGLSRLDCQNLLTKSLSSARDLNLEWRGFVPPTWHAPRFLTELCRAEGLNLYESRFWVRGAGVRDFSFPLSLPSLADDRTWERAIRMCRWIARSLPCSVRLVLHPEDLQSDWRVQRVDELLKFLSKTRMHRPYPDTAR